MMIVLICVSAIGLDVNLTRIWQASIDFPVVAGAVRIVHFVFSLRRYYPHQVPGVASRKDASQLTSELLRKLLLNSILLQPEMQRHCVPSANFGIRLAPALREYLKSKFFEKRRAICTDFVRFYSTDSRHFGRRR